MSNDDKFLEMQLDSVGKRLEKNEELFGKLFDSVNDIRVILERNTMAVEQNHKHYLTLEKTTAASQRRAMQVDKELINVKDAIAGVTTDLAPIKTHVDMVSRWVDFFLGIPGAIKFVSILFGFIIGGYGVYSIVHDSIGFFGK